MKYIKLFENFEDYDPYELMITPPNKKAEMLIDEIRKPEPNLNNHVTKPLKRLNNRRTNQHKLEL